MRVGGTRHTHDPQFPQCINIGTVETVDINAATLQHRMV